MTYRMKITLFLLGTFLAFEANAQTYRYVVKPKGPVKSSCVDNGQPQKSRIKIEITNGQTNQRLAPIRLRARVCTSIGYVRFSPRIVLPMRFLDQFQRGNRFQDFEMFFDPSQMTELNGRRANKVVVKNAGSNPKAVRRAGLNVNNVQWLSFTWKEERKDVFGPVYLGISDPDAIRARGFARRRDIPVGHIVINRDGRLIAGVLNEVN